MNNLVTGIIFGVVFGIAFAFIFKILRFKSARDIASEILKESETQRKTDRDELIKNIEHSFGSLSLEALKKSSDEFLKLATAKLSTEREVSVKELTEKKSLIDQQLQRMTGELEKVSGLMQELEKDRESKFGALENQLKNAGEQTAALLHTTTMLREALSSTKTRGLWGQRMAEDVLRLAGFAENINYSKQTTLEGGTRPDFTFFLPNNLILNMDVKFPLDNYLAYLDAKSDSEKSIYRDKFLRDVKQRMKEITSRDYINREQNTVDYVLLFIPNEQIYAFIHEEDSSIFEEGVKNKVIFCSPINLYVVLAVIRQAIDTFRLERESHKILSLLYEFRKQWDKYTVCMDSMGDKLQKALKENESLVSTRKNQLDRQLNKIDEIQLKQALPDADEPLDEPKLLE